MSRAATEHRGLRAAAQVSRRPDMVSREHDASRHRGVTPGASPGAWRASGARAGAGPGKRSAETASPGQESFTRPPEEALQAARSAPWPGLPQGDSSPRPELRVNLFFSDCDTGPPPIAVGSLEGIQDERSIGFERGKVLIMARPRFTSEPDLREDASSYTKEVYALYSSLPFTDTRDYDDVRRHKLLDWDEQKVLNDERDVVWDMTPYAYQDPRLRIARPETVNPSLWRQSQLNQSNGLFEVCPGIYQVRAFDMSNMTIVESANGIIIIDPLISCECAEDALKLYYKWKGNQDKKVVGCIFTHSHVDHFGGVLGVIKEEYLHETVKLKIVAPEGFMEHAVSENVYAGVAMSRRAQYMYGPYLVPDAKGQVDGGLGKGQSIGRVSIATPTDSITTSGQVLPIDGVDILFHMTPGGEAPAEFDFYFPDFNAFCAAENAVHAMHNIQTLRGAKVRDALLWSKYLNETLHELQRSDRPVDHLFASHHWPIWGKDRIVEFLTKQRDMYRYLNDQTLRMLNKGYTGIEIAEVFKMPPGIDDEWSCRGYYGSVNHNVKAVYDRYMGWFDGNPSNLHLLPPVESSRKYVSAFTRDALYNEASRAHGAGEYRWAAELLNKLIYADPADNDAKLLQARVLEQLGYQAEAATWRNFYLMGAQELRGGIPESMMTTADPSMVVEMTLEMIFDALAAHIHGPLAVENVGDLVMNWIFIGGETESYLLELSNGALSSTEGITRADADVTITITRANLTRMVSSATSLQEILNSGSITIDGDRERFLALFSCLDAGDVDFPIAWPRQIDAQTGWNELLPADGASRTRNGGPRNLMREGANRKLRILGKLPRGC